MVSKEEFHERIVNLIKNKGMTVAEFERKACVSNGTICHWKSSRPNMNNIVKVANVLEVNPLELLADELTTEGE